MKYFFLIVFTCSSFIISGFSQGQRQPEYDAIFQKIMKEYTLHSNGNSEYRCVKEIQLLTHNAFHRLYGETFIIYNPEYQSLKINECYTVMANGRKVTTPANAFNEVLPRFASNAPVFNSLKEMVVTHTALEVGAVIYLDYTLTSKKGFYPALMGYEELAETNPVLSYDVTVKVPDQTPLNYRLFNIKGEPVITAESGNRIFSWHFNQLKDYLAEFAQPDNSRFVPTLIFSSAKDINRALDFFLSQEAFKTGFTDDTKAFAEKIQQENPGELNAVLALQDKLVNEFALYTVPLQYIGYKIRRPDEVWKSNGGTEAEKMMLLISMLNSIGIQAEPMAYFPGYYDQGMGNLNLISHFYVLVTLKDKSPIILSLNELNDQNLLLRKKGAMLPLKKGSIPDPLQPKLFPNIISYSGNLEIDRDNTLEGKINIQKEGLGNPYFMLIRNPGKITSGISGIGASDIVEKKVVKSTEGTTEANITIENKKACKQEGTYYFYTWPLVECGIASWHLGEMVSERMTPVEIPYPLTESCSFELDIPSKWKLINPVEKLEIRNSAGSLMVECKQVKDKVLYVSNLSLYESPTVQSGNDYYLGLKELLARWNTLKLQGSIFKNTQ